LNSEVTAVEQEANRRRTGGEQELNTQEVQRSWTHKMFTGDEQEMNRR
jgi:hypothetical protein